MNGRKTQQAAGGWKPVGVILAGGLGRRMGGSKATAIVGGRPLIQYSLEVLRSVLDDVAVAAKRETELPPLQGIPVWAEPSVPRHPLAGIVEALRRASPRPVVVCAVDLPLITEEVIWALVEYDLGDAPAVVARCEDVVQPLLGRYQPGALQPLSAGLAEERPVREVLEEINARELAVEDPDVLFNINSSSDVVKVEAILRDCGR